MGLLAWLPARKTIYLLPGEASRRPLRRSCDAAGQRDGVVLHGHCGMNGIVDEIIAENQDAVLGLGVDGPTATRSVRAGPSSPEGSPRTVP